LDRFFMKVSLGYPNIKEESTMLGRFKAGSPLSSLSPVSDGAQIIAVQKIVEKIHVEQQLTVFIVELVRNTRTQEEVVLGASPRASLFLLKSAQAWALYQGREYVIPDDIILMAPHVLSHRIMMKQEARIKKITAQTIVSRAIESVKMPTL